MASTPLCTIISVLQRAPNLRRLWLDDINDQYKGQRVMSQLADFLIGKAAGSTTRVADVLPCPLLDSFSFIDCEDLGMHDLIHLVNAYVPSVQVDSVAGNDREFFRRSCDGTRWKMMEMLSVSSLDVEASNKKVLSFLRARFKVVDLDARSWPNDLEPDPFDFISFPFFEN